MSLNKELPIIKLRDISKNYGEKQVLHSIDLDIYAGQVIGYLGQNGVGKSTTVKILIGIIEDFYGEAQVCGFDVREHPLEVKRRIGYVPEVAALYDALNPLEYLQFIGRLHHMEDKKIEQRAVDMLTIFDLRDELHNPMTTFSKGMKQKVLIVAGVIHNPDVLFLDEPMSGLDANSVVLIKEIIAQLAKSGKTIFYCSHMMDVVERVCDRIVILSEGSIVSDSSFSDLQKIEEGSSLETIFTQLTSNRDNSELAKVFIQSFDFDMAG